MIKSCKTQSKSHFDSHVHPHTFGKGYLILVYDQDNGKLGKGMFNPMWYGTYAIHCCLDKGAYIVADCDHHLLKNPHNGLYLKSFYAWSLIPWVHLCYSFSFWIYTILFMSLIVSFLGYSRWILLRIATLGSLAEKVDALLISPQLYGPFIPYHMSWSISTKCVFVFLPTTRMSMMVSLVSWPLPSTWVFVTVTSS